MVTVVPPIKCQGIKTKLVPLIERAAKDPVEGVWIEPFCGSAVVALNVQPKRALLCDTNIHIIKLYQDIQSGLVTPGIVKKSLQDEGKQLLSEGTQHYLTIRERFNERGGSLEFLFLNRSCFNGVMRFNRKGGFNVPFCHKPDRFRQAYITKIVNQVSALQKVVQNRDWTFKVSDFRDTFDQAKAEDFLYVDPPYAGRHVDYFNGWNENDEAVLVDVIKAAPCHFLLSTWHSNQYRSNTSISQHWDQEGFYVETIEHFYHVGASEELRHPMKEALISNYKIAPSIPIRVIEKQLVLI